MFYQVSHIKFTSRDFDTKLSITYATVNANDAFLSKSPLLIYLPYNLKHFIRNLIKYEITF